MTFLDDNSPKEFFTTFKVLRKLPYEVIIGRKDMVIHQLTLPRNESTGLAPWERRAGHPILQTETRVEAQMGWRADRISPRAESPCLKQGDVPLGHADVSIVQDASWLDRTSAVHARTPGIENPTKIHCESDVRSSISAESTTPPRAMRGPIPHEDENLREPLQVTMGHNVESGHLDSKTPTTVGRPT